MSQVGRVAGALALLAAAATVWWLVGTDRLGREEYQVPGEGKSRITVEVFNASGVDGLARAATMHLRERGIDVVFYGTAPMDTLRLTRVVARQGDLDAAQRVRDALEVGEVVDEPDARLLLSATVYLGRDAAAALGFRP